MLVFCFLNSNKMLPFNVLNMIRIDLFFLSSLLVASCFCSNIISHISSCSDANWIGAMIWMLSGIGSLSL